MNKFILSLFFLLIITPLHSAVLFDGADDYMNLPNSPIIQVATPATFSCWVYLNAYPAAASMAMTNNLTNAAFYTGIFFSIAPTGELAVQYGDNTAAGVTGRRTKAGVGRLGLKSWYHIVAIVRNYIDMDLYINGVNDGGTYSGLATGKLAYRSQVGRLGNQDLGSNWDLNGYLEDVRIYNRALSVAEVQTLALSRCRANITDGLVGWWKLDGVDELAGSAYDYSGNGNHATPFNGAKFSGLGWINYP